MSETNVKQKISVWLKRNFCCYMPAVIISIVMLAIFILEKITPFGPNSLTIVDSIHQYVPFFSDYRHKLLNGESLFYTWDVALGSNFLSLGAYYFSSPFNLLLLLVSQEHIVAGVCVIVALKIALTGSTMAYYLSHIDKETDGIRRSDLYIIGLSLMYALSNYVVGYYWNTMWMDCIMIFPLIMLGFRRLMEEGKPGMYCLTLFYALFCNYYIGFMICVFLVLYFFVYLHGGFRHFVVNGVKFAIGSIVAGGMSAILLIPAYFGINATASGTREFPKWSWYGSFSAIFKQHMAFTEPITNQTFDGGVNLYCGCLAIFTIVLFLFVKRIKIAQKIRTILLLAFMAVSFNATLLNYIWHGLHDQYGIPNRFSFLYIFVLIEVAYFVLNRIEDTRPIFTLIALVLSLCACTMVYIMESGSLKILGTIVTLLLIFFYGLLVLSRQLDYIKRPAFDMILAGVLVVEMVVMGINGFMENGHTDYVEKYGESPAVHAAYKESKKWDTTEDGFYRTELVDSTVLDEATWYNMRSVGTFCSTVLGDLVTTMGKLGFYTGANEFLYMGSTPFTNSLLNVRYIFGREGDLNNFDFKYRATVDGVDIYENPYPASIGFAVSDNVKDWDFSGVERLNMQNTLAYDMTGIIGPFSMVYPEMTVSSDSCDVSIAKNVVTFSPKQTGRVSFTTAFTADSDGDYYVNCRGNGITKIRFTINGEEYAYDRYQIQIFHLGELKAGDYVTVEYIYEHDPSENTKAVLAVAKYDDYLYEQIYRVLSSHMLYDVSYKEGYVRGMVDMPVGQTLYTSIPYDEGWSVKVDGEPYEYYKLMGAFIGVDVPDGIHTVEFSYVPVGYKLGSRISLISWLLFIIICIFMPWIYNFSTKKQEISH